MIKLILVFIVVYITFMGVAVNYAKVFRVKNNVINIVEQNQFLVGDSIDGIDDYLKNVPYNLSNNSSVKSDCSSNYGSDVEFGNSYKKNVSNSIPGIGSTTLTKRGVCITQLGDADSIYYKVTAYISIEFPFFDLHFTIPVSGETKIISV